MGDHSLSGMLVLMLGAAVAQQPGNLKKEENPTMTLKECTLAGGCVSKQAKLCSIRIGAGFIQPVVTKIVTREPLGTQRFAQILHHVLKTVLSKGCPKRIMRARTVSRRSTAA